MNNQSVLQIVIKTKFFNVTHFSTPFYPPQKPKVGVGFLKWLMFMKLWVRGDGMTTFGQRVKKAWKNINEIKPKKDKKMKNE